MKKSERELFTLASDMSYIEDKLQENISEIARKELIEEASKIRDTLLEKNYDVNKFLYYKEFYKTLTVPEYY